MKLTVTVLKNDFKKEEYRNIDREITLEKKIKLLDNIVNKRDQSAQAIHMLTKPRFLYDHSTKQALGFQNSFYLKKAQQLEPKLYDDPNPSKRPTIVEVPIELPKVSMKDALSSNASAPTFAELFEINNLKAQAQAKDTVILKLKEKLHSLNSDVKDRDEKRNVEESKTLNIKLGHQVTKLATENNHLKQTYKQLYNLIKSLRVRSKEQCDDLIKKVNLKSDEVSDLNVRLQEKVLVITALKEQLDKLKGKAVSTEAVFLNPIDHKLLKVDVTPVV
nr:hypothetical protein [Tanacetum cinerariifolium]